jgi:hypothetical protein
MNHSLSRESVGKYDLQLIHCLNIESMGKYGLHCLNIYIIKGWTENTNRDQ